MSGLRCFIAIELPMSLQDAIGDALKDLRGRIGAKSVRWIPPRNLHLTLKFLGETTTSNLGLIREGMEAAAKQFEPFEVAASGFGTFPNHREPRILWVGLTAPRILVSLHRELDLAAARIGFASDGRAFSPHLTVGRTRQNIQSTEARALLGELEHTKLGEVGRWRVDSVCLFQSRLLPSGSVYTKLFGAALASG